MDIQIREISPLLDVKNPAILERCNRPTGSSHLGIMRQTVRKIGDLTKRCYIMQTIFFVLGAIFFIVFSAITYRNILYH